jgi:hypothetical protein
LTASPKALIRARVASSTRSSSTSPLSWSVAIVCSSLPSLPSASQQARSSSGPWSAHASAIARWVT